MQKSSENLKFEFLEIIFSAYNFPNSQLLNIFSLQLLSKLEMRNLLKTRIAEQQKMSVMCCFQYRSRGISLTEDKMSFVEKSLNLQRKFNFVSGCGKGSSELDSMSDNLSYLDYQKYIQSAHLVYSSFDIL